MPDESGYEGEPNPGGARAAEMVKGKFEELVLVEGAHVCPQCASVLQRDR
jgi:hypothetical protein